MKSPAIRILLILGIVYILANTFTMGIKRGFRLFNRHANNQFTELFRKNTYYDVVFFGSSRTHLSINPKVVDSVTGYKTYNAGINGGGMFEFYFFLKAYLEVHPSPKAVLLNIDLFSFRPGTGTFFYPVYIDYIDNRSVLELVSASGYNHYLYKSLPFLFLKDLDDNAKGYSLKGYLGSTDIASGEEEYKGYLTNSRNIITAVPESHKISYGLNRESIVYLDKFTALCSKKGIKLFFSYAPEYKHFLIRNATDAKAILSFINKKAGVNNVQFLRHDSLDLCSNPNLFANASHLNREGAVQYSLFLGKQLKQLLASPRL